MYEEKFKHKYEDVLMDAFGFNEDDLEANREGLLSEWQHKQFEKWKSNMQGIALVLLVSIVFIAIVNVPGYFRGWLMLVWMAVLVLDVGILLFVMWRWFTYDVILRKGMVDAIEDRIRLDIVTEKSITYSLYIGDMQFGLTKEQFLAFKNGEPYRIYKAPYLNRILSAEWLR